MQALPLQERVPCTAPRHFSLRMRLTVLAGAVVVALGVAEGGVRLLGIDAPTSSLAVEPHPLWHHWHPPDHEFRFHLPCERVSQTIRFNEHGMRCRRNVPVVKPARTKRVAVLGDSFVEALQVTLDEGFVPRLEAQLQRDGRAPIEVLNFGCSGFSSTLELVQLREQVLAFAPDLVLCLHHFSDITEDWHFSTRARYDGERLQAVRGQSGISPRRVLEHSQLFRLGHGALAGWRRHRPPAPEASLQVSFDAIVHDPYTAADLAAWDYSLAALDQMADLLAEHGIPFVVVLIPIGSQVEPVEPEFASRLGFRYLADGRRLEYRGYQDQVTRFCDDHGIDCLDLLDDFREANPSGRPWLYLPRDQHWSAAGHALAARLCARHLRGSHAEGSTGGAGQKPRQ